MPFLVIATCKHHHTNDGSDDDQQAADDLSTLRREILLSDHPLPSKPIGAKTASWRAFERWLVSKGATIDARCDRLERARQRLNERRRGLRQRKGVIFI